MTRNANRRVRSVVRERLPGDLYRWELRIDHRCSWDFFTVGGDRDRLRAAEELYEVLKRSAGGRWKVVRGKGRTCPACHGAVSKILLELEVDVVLVKLCHVEPLYRVFHFILNTEQTVDHPRSR